MLVSKRMRKEPVTVGPQDYLATVQKKMKEGGFRRIPVAEGGRLVGLVTDRDLRQHLGYLEKTKVNAVMTEKLVTVLPKTTLEEAAQLLLKHKIGGLPVVEDGQLVGIISASDILQAFPDVMGASEEETFRINLLLEGNGEFVYKVKTPVRFTFLNYSTLEQRRCAGGGFLVQSPLRPYSRHLLLVLT